MQMRGRATVGGVALAGMLLLGAGTGSALAQPARGAARDAGDLVVDAEALVGTVREAVVENYVFPDVAERCAARLEERLGSGGYGGLDAIGLAQAITADLRDVSNDLHFSVRLDPNAFAFLTSAEGEEHDGPPPNMILRQNAASNFGFKRVEHLAGNIGYLKLNMFSDDQAAAPTAHAAMAFLANCDAVIIDLRQNGGGSPGMVQLISSYFFPATPPTHLNSLYFRPTDTTEEYFTFEELPGKRMADTPLFLLTSGYTFSAAEEFAYNLYARERATIVGEVTGGGAHPGDMFPLVNGFTMFLPTGRAINPITGTNWEGKGVPVDVECAAPRALERAHLMALEGLLETAEEWRREDLEWTVAATRAELDPLKLDPALLREYAGDYGERVIEFREGELWYTRNAASGGWRRMIAISEDSFLIEGVPGFRLGVERDGTGRVAGVRGHYQQGREDYNAREDG